MYCTEGKTSQINKFIRNKRRLIELLKEQKQNIINQAVTRGLDPNVKLKPSDVEWIEDIPEHWKIRRLKTLVSIRYGLGTPPKELLGGVPMIRATNIERGKISEKGLIFIDPEDLPTGKNAFLDKDEIIVVRSGAYAADSAIITEEHVDAVAGYDMVVTVNFASPAFIAVSLLSKYVLRDQLFLARSRAAQPHLNAEDLGSTLIALPPCDEQVEIAQHINNMDKEINNTISKTNREIDLIREYHTRLISDVVTGQVDVRHITVPEADETDLTPLDEDDIDAEELLEEALDTEDEA